MAGWNYGKYNKKKGKKGKKKNGAGKGKYRRPVARMARPLTLKPKSCTQKLVYYNSFRCQPKMNSSATAGNKQQNYNLTFAINSLWPFQDNWNQYATQNGQTLTPNASIVQKTRASTVDGSETMMPGVRNGPSLYGQFSKACIVGSKTVIVATPIRNSTDIQMGYLYAIKHSQTTTGMNLTSNITHVQKLPYRKMQKLNGPDAPTSGFESGQKVGARIVVTNSPKKFNNIVDYRDNPEFFNTIGQDSLASQPVEQDFLTVGVIPALNNLDLQVTDFCLQIRHEVSVLYTEPLEALSLGGNFSLPRPASSY